MEEWRIDPSDLELEQQVGGGSFGEVWLSKFQGTPVAVKKLYDTDREDMQKYFEREIDTFVQLKHPNIVQLLGLAIDADNIFIVTEFVDNGDLQKKIIDPGWVINWKRRVAILRDVARAMIYLHGKGRMHRDLKGANLLLTQDWKTKVCDFGLARSRALDPKARSEMTIAGTEEWMAPEMLMAQPYDLPVDVFSFAIVMYEMIFRDLPPKRNPIHNYQFIPENFTPPEDTPADLWGLLCDCAHADPSKRPTFSAILSRLDAIDKTIPGSPEQYEDKDLRKRVMRERANKKRSPARGRKPQVKKNAPTAPVLKPELELKKDAEENDAGTAEKVDEKDEGEDQENDEEEEIEAGEAPEKEEKGREEEEEQTREKEKETEVKKEKEVVPTKVPKGLYPPPPSLIGQTVKPTAIAQPKRQDKTIDVEDEDEDQEEEIEEAPKRRPHPEPFPTPPGADGSGKMMPCILF